VAAVLFQLPLAANAGFAVKAAKVKTDATARKRNFEGIFFMENGVGVEEKLFIIKFGR
jgi:hypothetical protein